MIYSCHPLVKTHNREAKRKLTKELDKNIAKLYSIEWSFYQSLFNDLDNTYKDIYTFHLELYTKELEKMYKKKQFKLTFPEPKYFEKMFKPVEKWM